jgi:hypothetical protein
VGIVVSMWPRAAGSRACTWLVVIAAAVGLLLTAWTLLFVLWLSLDSADRRGQDAARRTDARCATPARPLRSPSGRFTLEAREGPSQNGVGTWRPVIRGGSGAEGYVSPEVFSLRYGVCLTWSPHKDLAWFGTGDVGITVLAAPRGTRGWSETDLRDVDAAEVPDVIREADPELFPSG